MDKKPLVDHLTNTCAGFQLREIGRITELATTSVKRYLNELEKEGLILKTRHRIHAYFGRLLKEYYDGVSEEF